MYAWWELRENADNCVDELALRHGITLGNPADPTLADCMHRLITLAQRTLYRSESEARCDRFLMNRWSCSMMLFG